MSLRRTAIAAGLALAVTVGAPAGAFDTPGSKNFVSPGYVPNYFSNEPAPVVGYAAPRAPAAVAAPAPSLVAPAQAAPMAAPPAATVFAAPRPAATVFAAPRPPAAFYMRPPPAAAWSPPRRTVVVIARNTYRVIHALPSRGPTRLAGRAPAHFGRVAATFHAAPRRPPNLPAVHAYSTRPAATHGRPPAGRGKRPGRLAAL